MTSNTKRVAYLSGIISSIYTDVELCFELSDDLLEDDEALETVDKSIVLLEVIGDLRAVALRLELLKSRMIGEESGVNGVAGEDEGP